MTDIKRYFVSVNGDLVESAAGGFCKLCDVQKLLKQFPEGMEHCTFEVLACPKGHSRLHATNWIDHGCRTCAEAQLQKALNDTTSKALAAVWLLVQEGANLTEDLQTLHDHATEVFLGKDKQTITRLEDRITDLQLELDNLKCPDLPAVRSVFGLKTAAYPARVALALESVMRDAGGNFVIEVRLP
jgi:hypothetical protein